jgi:hypothetical protein
MGSPFLSLDAGGPMERSMKPGGKVYFMTAK